MRKTFTLLELVIVIIIVATMVALGAPQLNGAIIRARVAEVYPALSAIYKAEQAHKLQYGYYASADALAPIPSNQLLGYFADWGQTQINEFSRVLGVDLPYPNTRLIYGVHYAGNGGDDEAIYVRVRNVNGSNDFDLGHLCRLIIGGSNTGKIMLSIGYSHPWAKYIKADM